MKKILALLLALCMVFALAACGETKPAEQPAAEQPAAEQPAAEEPAAEQPAAEEPAPEEPAPEEPAVMSYAEFAAAEIDAPVTIKAAVQAHQSWWNDQITVYAADADGAYFLYNLACTEEDAAKLVPGQWIQVTGFKSEWSGEVEIVDASFEFVDDEPFIAEPADATELWGTVDMISRMNQLVTFKGLTVEPYDETGAAFAYKDPEGKTDDLYFKVTLGDTTYDFCVEFYLCGKDTEVYQAVENLKAGDVIDLEGFLYWYNGPNLQATALTVVTPAPEEPVAIGVSEYKLGMGVSLNMNSSKAGNAQVDATVAAVVLNEEGRIVMARLDVAQSKMDVTDGAVDTEKTFKSKVELGDDYNMVKYSEATHEWYEQAAAFEAYVVGMTAEEVAALETVVNESGHTVTTDEELYASCSISIADFQEAIVKACNDEQGKTFSGAGKLALGLAVNTKADESKAATEDEDGVVKMYTDYAAVVVDAEGVILAALTDATQPQITIDADGEIVDTAFKGTKRELKEDYNMVKYSEATLEWYEQASNFADFAAGKTAEELQATELTLNEEGHMVFVDEELYAGCSISVDGIIAVLLKAVEYAK